MKKQKIFATVALAMCAAGYVHAEDAAPEHDISFNVSVVSDYRYRGISQTRLEPALQGGADYTHTPSGFYAGTWLSTLKWIKDAGGDGSIEWDFYGGKRGELGSGVSYDVGVLAYMYPSNGLDPNANTVELYGQLGYGPAYVKYSHSLTNLFGAPDSKNSGYLDVGADIDLTQGFVLNLHVGHQNVRNNSAASYTDWKIGVSKEFGPVTASLAYVGTDTDAYVGPNGKNLGKGGVLLSVGASF